MQTSSALMVVIVSWEGGCWMYGMDVSWIKTGLVCVVCFRYPFVCLPACQNGYFNWTEARTGPKVKYDGRFGAIY